ncbi:putative chaperone protein EcpD [compost metagenome]
MKLLYRPALEGSVLEAGDRLRWTAGGTGRAIARNDSPYYLTLTRLALHDKTGADCGEPLEHLMVAPFSTHEARAETCTAPTSGVAYSLIDDAGQEHPRTVDLQVD